MHILDFTGLLKFSEGIRVCSSTLSTDSHRFDRIYCNKGLGDDIRRRLSSKFTLLKFINYLLMHTIDVH